MADCPLDPNVSKILNEHKDLVLDACLKVNDYLLYDESPSQFSQTPQQLLQSERQRKPGSPWFRYFRRYNRRSSRNQIEPTIELKDPKQLQHWFDSFPVGLPTIFYSLLSPYKEELKEKNLKMVHFFCAILYSLGFETKPPSSYPMLQQSVSLDRLKNLYLTDVTMNPWKTTRVNRKKETTWIDSDGNPTKKPPYPSMREIVSNKKWSKIQPASTTCPVQLIHDQETGKFIACCLKLDSRHTKKREAIIDLLKIITGTHNSIQPAAPTNSKTCSGKMVAINDRSSWDQTGLQGNTDIVSILNSAVSCLHTLLVKYFGLTVKHIALPALTEDFSNSILADYFRDQPLPAISMLASTRYEACCHTDSTDTSFTYGFCFQPKEAKGRKLIFPEYHFFLDLTDSCAFIFDGTVSHGTIVGSSDRWTCALVDNGVVRKPQMNLKRKTEQEEQLQSSKQQSKKQKIKP